MSVPAARLTVLTCSLLFAEPSAASVRVRLEVRDCALNRSELQRLIGLELSSVLTDKAADRYHVILSCQRSTVHIHLRDPLTQKTLQREVVAPSSSHPEPERLIALSVAQLYRASWLELAAPPEETDQKQGLPPATASPLPAGELDVERDRATREARQTLDRAGAVGISLLAGARQRWSTDSLLLPQGELALNIAFARQSRWLAVVLGVERTHVERIPGELSVGVEELGLALGSELAKAGQWSVFSEAQMGVTHTSVSGTRVADGFRGGSVDGFGVHGRLGAGITLAAEPVRFELLLRGGALFGTPTAFVADDDAFSLNGPLADLALRARYSL